MDDPTALVDDGSRTLVAQVAGKIGIANISVTSIPILELLNVLAGALLPSDIDVPPLVQITDVPMEQVIGGDSVRIILEMLITPEAACVSFAIPFHRWEGLSVR